VNPLVVLDALRRRTREAAYLRKWVVLGAVIGLISGLGAALFFVALETSTHLFLGLLAGFTPATPIGEGGSPIADALRPWAIPLVVALGGLISGIIVFRWAPEAEGHGTDAAIAAFHHRPRQIRARIPLIKLVASAITIGSGGSGGREGPTAQIGAGFGSLLARVLDLDARDARIAVSSGMGAGIGAIFRAPLGGAVLAAEIPYREDVESEALVPAFIASIVAVSVFGALIGFAPIFGLVQASFTDPRQLLYYAAIGLAAGVVGRLYIVGFYRAVAWFGRWRLPRAVPPAVAGLAVGLLGLAIPGVLGTGYGWVQAGLDRGTLLGLPLWVVLALPFAKILATALSIGSGGSGGIFGPGMVIGGLLGATAWRLLEPIAPAVPVEPAGFVIVGMMALFGSIAHAPLAVMLMVAEMTGNLGMLAPAMLAIGLATLVVGERSIYESQLRSRVDSPAHRFRSAMPLLASIPAGHATRMARMVLRDDLTVHAARERLLAAGLPGAPVVDRDGALRGSVTQEALALAEADARLSTVSLDGPIVAADDGLDDALAILADHHRSWAPVVSSDRLLGVLSTSDALTAYRRALAGNVRQVRPLGAAGMLVDAEVGEASVLAGHPVSEIEWPRETVLVAITRGEQVVVPRGNTVLQIGDRLSLFAAPAGRATLEALLASEVTTASDG
jgi:H+/Cl- antiporter ClcA/CBS domain-containing protein